MGGSSKQYVGDKFYLGMHQVLCQAPIKRIKKIRAGGRIAWEGDETTDTTININKPELFGGDKKEGGIVGPVDLMFGTATQPQNPYLLNRLGTLLPAYRGLVSAVLNQCYVAAISPYIKRWEWEIEAIQAEDWYPETAELDGANNPAHMVYYCLTELMGYPTSVINDASFRAAADVYHQEGLGLSMLLSGGTVDKFIEDVARHCHSIVDQDPVDGLFFMLPLRGGYDSSAAPLFDEANILRLDSFDRPSYGELVNEIVVKFRPQGTDKEDTVSFHNLASVQSQGGVVSQSIEYPGIDKKENAVAAASRDLPLLSTALARVKFRANREAATLKKGDVIRFSWADHGLVEVVMRVTSVDYGDLANREILVDAAEDVFGAPTADYLQGQDSLFVEPSRPPEDPTNRRLVELGYYQVADQFGETNLDDYDDDTAFVGGMIGEEPYYVSEWQFWTRIGSAEYEEQAFEYVTPLAQLNGAIGYQDTVVPIDNLTDSVDFVVVNSYAYIGDEIVRIDAITNTEITIGRGCLDTIPRTHADNTLIWFAEEYIAIDENEYSDGISVNTYSLPRSGGEVLTFAQTTVETLALEGRFGKPYPPANVQLNSLYYPTTVANPVDFTWSHRDRTQQLTKPLITWNQADVGPEEYVLQSGVDVENSSQSVVVTFPVAYNLRIYDRDLSNRLIVEEKGITQNNFNYPADSIYYTTASGSAVLGPYSSTITIFQNATSTGQVTLGSPAVTETYLNSLYVFDNSYTSTEQGYGPNASFAPFQTTGLDDSNGTAFTYSPTSSDSSTSNAGGFQTPVNIRNNPINFSFVSSLSAAGLGGDVTFDIDFLDMENNIVFSFKAEKENQSTAIGANWVLILAAKDSELRTTRNLTFTSSFSLNLRANSDSTVTVSGSIADINLTCPAVNVRTMRVNTSQVRLVQSSGSTNSTRLAMTHRMNTPTGQDYPLSLAGRNVTVEIETLKLDNTSKDVFTHDFSVT